MRALVSGGVSPRRHGHHFHIRSFWAGQTLSEKIVEKHTVKTALSSPVKSGDFVLIEPRHLMTHDNTAAVMEKFFGFWDLTVEEGMGEKSKKSTAIDTTPRIKNPLQPVFALDHNVQDVSPSNLEKYRRIEQFATWQSVVFHPAGRGIGHQIMCEEGFAWPGSLVVASDSHSNMYGGLGCLGTPVVRTDAAAIWATGQTWWEVPKMARVHLKGSLRAGVTGKDVIITLCGLFSKGEVLNHVVEFTGPGATSLSIEERLSIANMTTEWGTAAGVFECDDKTIAWLRERARKSARITEERLANIQRDVIQADPDCTYAIELELDLDRVTPSIAGPNHVSVTQSLAEAAAKRIAIQKAYIVSCVNSRQGDLRQAAAVLKGKKVHPSVELYVSAASSRVQEDAEADGSWATLLASGAKTLAPGCGPCIGLGAGLLKDGEVGISATNRNFKGRMGSPKAYAYLASPEVVAASAVAGFISGPGVFSDTNASSWKDAGRVTKSGSAPVDASGPTELMSGFPTAIEGSILLCNSNNVNTDAIYPGKYTYREDIKPEEQAAVAMENYDAAFQKLAQAGNILVSGFNFGTGSSREQAATALKHKGISLLVAGSFNETYKRNALNNGLLVIEVPDLAKDLMAQHSNSGLTVATNVVAKVSFRDNSISILGGKTYRFAPVGPVAQRLIISGGLESMVRDQIHGHT